MAELKKALAYKYKEMKAAVADKDKEVKTAEAAAKKLEKEVETLTGAAEKAAGELAKAKKSRDDLSEELKRAQEAAKSGAGALEALVRQLEKELADAGQVALVGGDGVGAGVERNTAGRVGFFLPQCDVEEIFAALDKNGDGSITQAEMIRGLKRHPWAASKLGMPSQIRQEDGTRNSYQLAFGSMDSDESKTIDLDELLMYCGHRRRGQASGPSSSEGLSAQIAAAKVKVKALIHTKVVKRTCAELKASCFDTWSLTRELAIETKSQNNRHAALVSRLRRRSELRDLGRAFDLLGAFTLEARRMVHAEKALSIRSARRVLGRYLDFWDQHRIMSSQVATLAGRDAEIVTLRSELSAVKAAHAPCDSQIQDLTGNVASLKQELEALRKTQQGLQVLHRAGDSLYAPPLLNKG